jgi:hypothetical protein
MARQKHRCPVCKRWLFPSLSDRTTWPVGRSTAIEWVTLATLLVLPINEWSFAVRRIRQEGGEELYRGLFETTERSLLAYSSCDGTDCSRFRAVVVVSELQAIMKPSSSSSSSTSKDLGRRRRPRTKIQVDVVS